MYNSKSIQFDIIILVYNEVIDNLKINWISVVLQNIYLFNLVIFNPQNFSST